MKKGTRVGWTLKNGETGSGTVISDEEDGHVLIAVDPPAMVLRGPVQRQDLLEFHPVIFCAVTWLTVKE